MIRKLLLAAAFFTFGQNTYAQTSEEKTSGFVNITEITLAKSLLTNDKTFLYGIQTINGIQLGQHFSSGLGVGVERSQYGGNYLPVFGDFRVTFGGKNIKPFFDQTAGFTFFLFNQAFTEAFDTKGFITTNSSVGLSFPSSFGKTLNVSLGYRFMYDNIQFIDKSEYISKIHVLTFKAGFTF